MAASGAIRAGRAFVELFADDSKLVRGLKIAQAKLAAFGKGITAAGQGVMNLGLGALGAGLAGLAPLAGATKLFADMGSALQDASERTGVAVEELSALQFAAEQGGASFEELENAIKFMQKGGHGKGAQDLEQIADRIAAIQDPARQTAMAMQIFGKAGTKLLPMLKGGAAGLRAMTDEARAAGIVMSKEDAAAADKLGDSFGKLWTMIKFTAASIGGALAPVVTELAGDIMPIVLAVARWIKENKGLVVTFAKIMVGVAIFGAVATAIGAGIVVVGKFFTSMATVASIGIAVFKALAGAVAFLMTPIGLVVLKIAACGAAVAAFGAAVVLVSGGGTHALNAMGTAWGDMKGAAVSAWGGIVDAIKAGDLSLAFEIAWAGVKVVWTAALAGLKTFWINWTGGIVDNWHGTIAMIRFAWASLMAVLKAAAITALNGIIAALNLVTTGLNHAIDAANKLGAGMNRLEGLELLAGGNIAEEVEAARRAIGKDWMEGQAQRQKERDAKLAEVQAPVNAAKAELARLVAEAAKKRQEAAAGAAAAIPMGKVARTSTDNAFGTFSNIAARMLSGRDTLAKQQLKQQELAVKRLEDLKRLLRARQGGMVLEEG